MTTLLNSTSGWLVMKLAQASFKEMCARSPPLTYKENYALLEQAAAGVSCAHGHDPALVPSDVKTAKFLVFGNRSDGLCVKLSDFGQAFELSENRGKNIRKGGAIHQTALLLSFTKVNLFVLNQIRTFLGW